MYTKNQWTMENGKLGLEIDLLDNKFWLFQFIDISVHQWLILLESLHPYF